MKFKCFRFFDMLCSLIRSTARTKLSALPKKIDSRCKELHCQRMCRCADSWLHMQHTFCSFGEQVLTRPTWLYRWPGVLSSGNRQLTKHALSWHVMTAEKGDGVDFDLAISGYCCYQQDGRCQIVDMDLWMDMVHIFPVPGARM